MMDRRKLLVGAAAAGLALATSGRAPAAEYRLTPGRLNPPPQFPLPAARLEPQRTLRELLAVRSGYHRVHLYNVHTGETIDIDYARGGQYDAGAINQLSHFLRDWREDAMVEIDPKVLDILASIQAAAAPDRPIHVLSGYRTPATNALLATIYEGVAKNSLHMRGKAIDFCVPGCDLRALRDHALGLAMGGVGYYPRNGFIHVDSGPVRAWG